MNPKPNLSLSLNPRNPNPRNPNPRNPNPRNPIPRNPIPRNPTPGDGWSYASNWLLVMSTPIIYLGWILLSTGMLLAHNEYVKLHGKRFRARYPTLFQRVRGAPGSYERITGIARVYLGLFLTHTRDRRAILSAFRAQVCAHENAT